MILRDLAAAWVRANCLGSDVQDDFLERLDDALRRGVGCSFVIGRKLMKDGKPHLVHCFCGELFAFQLTPRQASRLKVKDAMLVSASGLTEHDHEPHPDPPVRLEQVDVDSANALDRSKPITGTLTYRSDQMWVMPVAIVLDILSFRFDEAKSNGACERTALTSLIDRRLMTILRTKKRYEKHVEPMPATTRDDGDGESEPFTEPIEQESLAMDVRDAIAALPAEEQAVCTALADGESIAEIARRLGRNWHAANKLVARVRQHFEVLGLDAWIRG